MKINKRTLILMIVLVCVIVGFLYNSLFFTGFNEKLSQADSEIKALNDKIKDMSVKAASIKMAKEKLKELEADAEVKLKGIPEGLDEPYLLVLIQNALAGLSGSPKVDFRESINQGGLYMIKSVDISFMTDYSELKEILDRFANLEYVNRVIILNATNATPQDTLTGTPSETLSQTPPPEQGTLQGNLAVSMSVDFIYFEGEPNRSYDFMTGPFGNEQLMK